jgi:S-adenosylmethionine:tRNA ribosyltransferase-isomerase
LLILNDTRVIPARLLGRRTRTGGKWEGLFLRETTPGCWELLSQTGGRLLPGETVVVEPGSLHLTLLRKTDEGHWLVSPEPPVAGTGDTLRLLERHGRVPLPPYIRKGRAAESDSARYQTEYARAPGAVAAPTAGLHFSADLLRRLEQESIDRAFVTLHVGIGTFQPIQVEDVTRHRMHAEWGELPAATAAAFAACRARRGRIVAVGTTSVRVLETAAGPEPMASWRGETDLYIHPPYQFRAVDVLITNFHLPRSTLLLLVSAFTGVDLLRQAYMTAVEQRYRFYSYGDAMLIL